MYTPKKRQYPAFLLAIDIMPTAHCLCFCSPQKTGHCLSLLGNNSIYRDLTQWAINIRCFCLQILLLENPQHFSALQVNNNCLSMSINISQAVLCQLQTSFSCDLESTYLPHSEVYITSFCETLIQLTICPPETNQITHLIVEHNSSTQDTLPQLKRHRSLRYSTFSMCLPPRHHPNQ